jgi:hypothetical protein
VTRVVTPEENSHGPTRDPACNRLLDRVPRALAKAIEIGDRAVEPPTYLQLQKASRAWALKQLARVTARAKAWGVEAHKLATSLATGPGKTLASEERHEEE